MVDHTGAKKKVHIGGTIDSDVAEWLMMTKGKEKFSAHLNDILRGAMGGRGSKRPQGGITSLGKFKSTVDSLRERVKALQDRVESIEAGMGGEIRVVKEKRPRGRPRKARPAEEPAGPYDVHADVDWYLSHDKYKKVKPQPLENAFGMVMREFERGGEVTVGMLKADYDQAGVGVPYPTFKLFYFPLIRDRMLSKGLIQKVEHAGKKGVYMIK